MEGVAAHWHGGRAAVSTFFNNLSVFFPAGERFFIASVKAHRKYVTSPELERDVQAFCAQEGMHGREHVRYNEMLAAHGYPVVEMEARVKRLLDRVSRRLPKRARLAVTCALEHFTALMAHMVLSDPGLLQGADSEMARLWRWHAAEENEHKAVAFDVYQAAGGGYWLRVEMMLGATLIFWLKVVEQQIRMMRADGTLFSPRQWADLLWFCFGKPGGLRRLLRPYLAFYRREFHPWDFDNRALLDDWRRGLSAA